MARSGNGTANRQYLYVMWNWPFFHIVKIGITGNPSARLRSVNKSAPGNDFYIFKVRIIAAYYVEQFIHALCFFLRVKFWGSGKTERFLFIAAVPAMAIGVIVWVLQYLAFVFALFVLLQLMSCQPYRPAIKLLFKLPCCCRERFIECTKAVYTHEYNAMIGAGADRQAAIDTANLRAIRWVGAVQLNADRTDWGNLCDCAYWPQYSRWRLTKRESNPDQ